MKKLLKLTVVAILLAAMLLVTASCGSKGITIGSKQFTENILLAEMLSQLVEAKTDLKVERKLNLGGTSVIFPAMEKGDVDVYVEYTGTAFLEIMKREDIITDPQATYDIVKPHFASEYNITWFDPIGINNTYAVAVTRDFAAANNIQKNSDLAPLSPELRFGANHLFYARINDGYDTMVDVYGLNFKDSKQLDSSVLYDAIASGELDVIIIYATDAKLKELNLLALEDDKQIFPPYFGAPMLKNETLEKYPELGDILNTLAGQIDDVTMQELNYQVEGMNRTVEDVAKEFLQSKGFI